MGDIKSMKEIKELAKVAGFPQFVGGGIAGYTSPLEREMAGEWIFENEKKERYLFVVQGKCNQCSENLKRWANWHMSKETDEPLEAECADGHLIEWDKLEDERPFEILWQGQQVMGYFEHMAKVAGEIKKP